MKLPSKRKKPEKSPVIEGHVAYYIDHKSKSYHYITLAAALCCFAVVGTYLLSGSLASVRKYIFLEPESANKVGNVTVKSDGTAAGGSALRFDAPPAAPAPAPTPTPTPTPAPVTFQLGVTKPDASNTGVPAGTTLTPLYGDLTITTAGTVIDSRDIYGFVSIRAANVTIKNSKIRGRDIGYNSASNGHLIDVSNAAATGAVIERNTLRPDYPRWWMNAIYGGNYKAHRNNISGTVDGFTVRSGSTTITGNYLHDFFFSDQSTDQANSNPPSWTHNDGIQFRVASGSGPHLVQGNNFYWYPDVNSPIDRTGALANGYGTSYYKNGTRSAKTGKLLWGAGITASPDLGPITGVNVTQNWFEGGTACFQMSTLSPAAGPMNFGAITNNKFGMDQFDYGNGSYYQIRYKNGGIISGLTSNVFDPNAATVPSAKKGVNFSVGFTGGIRIDP